MLKEPPNLMIKIGLIIHFSNEIEGVGGWTPFSDTLSWQRLDRIQLKKGARRCPLLS
jgi:hypothetical protein